MLTQLGHEASMADAIEAYVAEAGLEVVEQTRARQGLHAIIEAESADLAERQSLRWMWNEFEYDGAYFGDVPAGGYRRVADVMAAGPDVRLNWDVTEVDVAATSMRAARRGRARQCLPRGRRAMGP